MLSFLDAYTIWRQLPFPFSGSDERLISTHSDLAGADEYVTTVIRYVERGIFKPFQTDVLALLEEIVRKIEQINDLTSDKDRDIARSQHAYAVLLDLVYRQFLEAGRTHKQPNQA